VGFSGENTFAALLAARDRVLLGVGSEARVTFEEVLANWLVRMGLLESFKANSMGGPGASIYQVVVRTPGSRRQVNLADVGFGVSQVLPVLVQLLYVERDATLIFEQPELHLHPRVQSELADLFIETIQMRQDGEPRGIQCLVESHSEHFLRRLQRRIAEGKLAPDQTALYFCKPGPDGSTIEELKLDEFGNISNWPEHFFGDEVGDLAAMTEAAMKRQLGPEGE
jgi:predicted ATPase